jgi:transposase
MRQLEKELGIGEGCIRQWKRKLVAEGEDAFPGHGKLPPDEERIRQLERELEIVRQERDILKKAVAIFSRPSK